MNIPFYRYVKYMDDGHELYQCLQCGRQLDVGAHYTMFDPKYCCYCGVEYKGFMLPKKTDYISLPSYKVLWFQIEEAYDWEDGELRWSEDWRGHESPHQAIKYLAEAKVEKKHFNKHDWDKYKFRIVVKRKEKHRSCIIIDTYKYYRRTGKKFNRNDYERVA